MSRTSGEHRFTGDLAQEYELITLAYPDFEAFQHQMIEGIDFSSAGTDRDVPFHLLEIGTGDGFTTTRLVQAMLEAPGAGLITSIDNDPNQLHKAQEHLREATKGGHVHLRESDALAYLQDSPDESFDVVATAFTLHNLEAGYRREVERQIFRILRPGGLFTNADKYAPRGQEQFDALAYQIERFFQAFVPRGKLEILQKWVLHNISDQSPRYAMFADETVSHLEAIGFKGVEISHRSHMQAVLRARVP
ncbi:Ubiquinone/menaquinone biosynthesis C-methylase UbiE [Alkalispirochaeta americana]|uniref:Ubiquinone/menaquinone biosynthesis C-methylase UbiE n=1 Tax=Alkalispirochaeta americana TaxID=159291 RepID=A0A1N6QI65_9SPIO|nr:class I SAM-dependent methyltransferase [Alkalispirochaeta americana]SIQ16056.1 Ubiquinone/menaquinone biosynthesis C-methylase UbiE [Alkalispirochaeta americana]